MQQPAIGMALFVGPTLLFAGAAQLSGRYSIVCGWIATLKWYPRYAYPPTPTSFPAHHVHTKAPTPNPLLRAWCAPPLHPMCLSRSTSLPPPCLMKRGAHIHWHRVGQYAKRGPHAIQCHMPVPCAGRGGSYGGRTGPYVRVVARGVLRNGKECERRAARPFSDLPSVFNRPQIKASHAIALKMVHPLLLSNHH